MAVDVWKPFLKQWLYVKENPNLFWVLLWACDRSAEYIYASSLF